MSVGHGLILWTMDHGKNFRGIDSVLNSEEFFGLQENRHQSILCIRLMEMRNNRVNQLHALFAIA